MIENSVNNKATVAVLDLGLIPYEKSLELQTKLHKKCVAGDIDGVLVIAQHPKVLTFGKHATPDHLLQSEENLRMEGVEFYNIDRGGQITAHMPGQLIVYPILSIKTLRLAPKRYVKLLEESIIELLQGLGVVAHRSDDYPGVWVGQEKVCAIGIRIKERVTMHGLALNVNNDLDLFNKIIPCGISGRGVTSMKEIIGKTQNFEEISMQLEYLIAKNLGVSTSKVEKEPYLKNI